MTTTQPEDSLNVLAEAIQDNLPPQAVALIAAKCELRHGNPSPEVEQAVAWFGEFLIDLLGTDEYEQLRNELGL